MANILEIQGLSVNYAVDGGEMNAVNDLWLDIPEGGIYALVGESGCGKSTVAYSVMRLTDEENADVTGKILFEGRDLNSLSEREMEDVRGKSIGMVFQNPLDSLNPVYRSGRQVEEAILIDNVTREDAYKRVIKLFEDVRIPNAESKAQNFPYELSGGMRQRVMISMMLSRDPKLIIADEPTTALDVTIEAQILRILRELKEKHGASVLVITHNFGIVAEIADRVGVMYAGELVEEATVYDIFKDPRHPYTRALMNALPRISKRDGRIETIPGSVPRIMGTPVGCRFRNRCAFATDKCANASPVRVTDGSHMVRCFHLDAGRKEAR